MKTQLVEILPREIKFIFEVKKQSSCAVHLSNVTEQYVAFKVKTTSPKKYCVRPNVGIIKPKSTCDFIVTMQAQKSAPTEVCKDKFLIQSTAVPFGTTEEEITSGMFVKDCENYIEETKIRVALASVPNSPGALPAHGVIKQEAFDEVLLPERPQSSVLLPVNGVSKQEPSFENSTSKVKLQAEVENLPSPDRPIGLVEQTTIIKNMEESMSLNIKDREKLDPAKGEEFYPDKDEKSIPVGDDEATNLKLTKDVLDLQSKIISLDSKLVEAESTILKLKEEKMNTVHETETLKQELFSVQALSRRKSSARKVQVGFPPLFVCMVALISMAVGFMVRA